MPARSAVPRLVTVTLNTAIDRVLEAPGLAIGAHLPARQTHRAEAGKGVNVALAIARLGGACIATGFVGRAETGDFDAALRSVRPGRAISQLLPVAGPTRENITLLDPEARTDTHLRTAGYELSKPDCGRMRTKLEMLSEADGLVALCGSLPEGLDPSDLGELLVAAGSRGAKVILDTDGPVLKRLLGPQRDNTPDLWLLKPNRDELAAMTGKDPAATDAEVLEQARVAARRARWVVVTLGSSGAVLCDQEQGWQATCDVEPGQVTSTVGCGDCLLGAMMLAVAGGAELPEALRRGVAAAAANARHAAESGVARFPLEDYQAFLDRAAVHPMPG